jgi:hypothetical protein
MIVETKFTVEDFRKRIQAMTRVRVDVSIRTEVRL